MILDTNALSAFADGKPEIKPVLVGSSVALPVIVLGEYLYGIAHSVRGREHTDWLESLLTSARVLEVTMRTARHYARIRSELRRAGTPIPANDHWIAALARQYDLPVLSRDRHFDKVSGLQRVSW